MLLRTALPILMPGNPQQRPAAAQIGMVLCQARQVGRRAVHIGHLQWAVDLRECSRFLQVCAGCGIRGRKHVLLWSMPKRHMRDVLSASQK